MPKRKMRVQRRIFARGQLDGALLSLLALSSIPACGGRSLHRGRAPSTSSAGGAPADSTSDATDSGGAETVGAGGTLNAGGTPAAAGAAVNSSGAPTVAGSANGVTCGDQQTVCPAGTTCSLGSCVPLLQACRSSPTQGARGAISTGKTPYAIIVGDWNADGFPDFATTNEGDDSVSVLLGCGDGSFSPRVDYRVGPAPYGLASCDLNVDGQADLIVASFDSGMVTVLLGKGDGTFVTGGNYPGGHANSGGARSLACADLSGDGIADVGMIHGFSGPGTTDAVSVLLGLGDGTLTTGVDYPTAGGTVALLIADLNEDGKADLVTGNYSDFNISVLLGKGDGTFAEHLDHYEAGSYGTTALAAADLNGDGHLDLGVGDPSGRGPPGLFGMLPGKGDGTLGDPVDYPPSQSACEVATGDLNGDGRIDLVGENGTTISVLLGQDGGGLQRGSDYDLERSVACALATSDVNGDGKLDILTPTESDQVSVLFGIGDGTFRK